jgi:RNase H-fold protein (predicted Holliday junction resolvase)
MAEDELAALKKENADMIKKMEVLEEFKKREDDKKLMELNKMLPEVQAFVTDIVAQNKDFASEMKQVEDWSKTIGASDDPHKTLPLARWVHCASADYKRKREEASLASETSKQLATALQELESKTAKVNAYEGQIKELQDLCDKRQTDLASLTSKLEEYNIIQSNASSNHFASTCAREANADVMPTDMSLSTVKASASSSNAAKVSNNSSHNVEDDLASFVTRTSRCMGQHKILQSNTSHAILGMAGGSAQSEIESLIRAY